MDTDYVTTREQLRREADGILADYAKNRDDEQAHIDEDRLHLAVIKAFCPDWVVAEIDRLSKADFARWCA